MRVNLNTLNYLDRVRVGEGVDKLKRTFSELTKKQKDKALKHINDKNLQFNTLFILRPEIDHYHLYNYLNQRNKTSLKICAHVLKDKETQVKLEDSISENQEKIHQTLKWMFQTGVRDDGRDNKFDEMMDVTAALLVRSYKDTTILSHMADTIFSRNRKGYFNHDLIWAFFQSRDPHTLQLIAERLNSPSDKDFDLACKLLNIKPDLGKGKENSKQTQYTSYMTWLKENYPYLYFTGQSFQLASNPMPFLVDLNAKYLCKSIHPQGNDKGLFLTEEEHRYLEDFNKLDVKEKRLLAHGSHVLHKRNIRVWKKWMQLPLHQKIQDIKTGLGGDFNDFNF